MNCWLKLPKLIRRLRSAIWRRILSRPTAFFLRYCYGVRFGCNPIFVGWPIFNGEGKIEIGDDCVLVSSPLGNPIGLFRPCIIGTFNNSNGNLGIVKIGNRFSASGVCIWAQKSVTIGEDVMIGANVSIIDTDFHPMDWKYRKDKNATTNASDIVIEDHVWIGMNAVILKGVTIGKGAVIGANCVVTKNVPSGSKVVSAQNRLL